MHVQPDFDAATDADEEPLVIHRRGATAGRALVVFLHGLNGHRYATWTPENANPAAVGFAKFLYEDVDGLDVGLYAYRTGVQRWRVTRSIELEDEATVLTDLLRDCAGTYSVLILVAHSMGGLLGRAAVRELIERNDVETLGRLRGMFLLATPLAGSLAVPPFLWWLTADGRALKAHGPLASNLHDVFVDRVVVAENGEAPAGKFSLPTWVVSGAEDWWVDRLSSGLTIPRAQRKTIRGTHTSVIKPATKSNDAYDWVLARIRSLVGEPGPPGGPRGGTPSASWTGLSEHLRDLQTRFRQHLASAFWTHTARDVELPDIALRQPAARPVVRSNADRVDHPLPEPGTTGHLSDFIAEPGSRCILVGSGGGGKTTLLLRTAARAAQEAERDAAAAIPFYLDLRAFGADDDAESLPQLIAAASGLGIGGDEFDRLRRLSGRRLLFLFDGFNEVPREQRRVCLQAIDEFWLGRHTYVLATRELEELELLLQRGWMRVEMLGLDPEQAALLLRAVGAHALDEQLPPSLASLMRNPFHVQAVAQSLDEGGTLPRNRGQLYRDFVARWSRREKARGPRYDHAAVKGPVLAALALRMTDQGRTRVNFEAEKDEIGRQLAAIDRRRGRREIMPPDWTVEGFLDELLHEGLVVLEGNDIAFMHHSVQEYFVAVASLAQDATAIAAAVPELVWRHVEPHRYELPTLPSDSRTEAAILLVGLVDDASALVEAIHRRHPLVAAACLGAASFVDQRVRAMVSKAWVAFLGARHPRYAFIACGCIAEARITDELFLGRLADLALHSSADETPWLLALAMRSVDPERFTRILLDRLGADDLDNEGLSRMGDIVHLLDRPPPILFLFARSIDTSRSSERTRAPGLLATFDREKVVDALDLLRKDSQDGPAGQARREFLSFLSAADAAQPMVATVSKLAAIVDALADQPWHTQGPSAATLREEQRRRSAEIANGAAAAAESARHLDLPLLLIMLDGAEVEGRIAAATVLGERRAAVAAPALVESLLRWDERWSVEAIISALAACIGAAGAVEALVERVSGSPSVVLFDLEPEWQSDLEAGKLPDALNQRLEQHGQSGLTDIRRTAEGWTLAFASDTPREVCTLVVRERRTRAIVHGRLTLLVDALQHLRCPEARSALAHYLNHADPDIRRAAVRGLSALHASEAAPRLARLLQDERDRKVIEEIVPALGSLRARVGLDPLMALLFAITPSVKPSEETLNDQRRYPGWGSLVHAALARIDDGRNVAPVLASRLVSGEANQRIVAAQETGRWLEDLLRATDPRSSAPWCDIPARLLEGALTETDANVRVACAQALRWSRHVALDALRATVRDADPGNACAAADALGFVQDDSVASELQDLATNGPPSVRAAATQALLRLHAIDDTRETFLPLVQLALEVDDEDLHRRVTQMADESVVALYVMLDPVHDAWKADDLDLALERIVDRLRIAPAMANLRTYRAITLHSLGRNEEALPHLEGVPGEHATPMGPVGRWRAKVLAALGRPADAVEAARSLPELEWTRYRVEVAGFAADARDWTTVLELSREALDEDSDDVDAAFLCAIALLSTGSSEDSDAAFDHADALVDSLEANDASAVLATAVERLSAIRDSDPALAARVDRYLDRASAQRGRIAASSTNESDAAARQATG